LDGDSDVSTSLHILALNNDADDWDAELITTTFKDTGVNLDSRLGGRMLTSKPILYAADCCGNYVVIKALVEVGANVDISNELDRALMSLAAT